jgi:DNA-binding NtrC family response regulator
MTVQGSSAEPLLVFLVDDDPAVASSLAGILRTSGCRVNTFLSGSDLIAFRPDEPPDVVLTDFIMQPIDGLRVAAWVRSTYPAARIIMITGDETVVLRAARQRLPFPVMEKPLNSIALIAAVRGFELSQSGLSDSSVA